MSIAWSVVGPILEQSTPPRWQVRRVGDLVTLLNGFPFPSSQFGPDGDIPLVRVRDLQSEEFETFVYGSAPRESIIRDGDVVIGMDGDFNVTLWNRGEAALNQRVCALKPRPDVDIRFVSYALRNPLKVINELTFSTTVKHLSSGDVLSERILVPPLEEQRRIADFLDAETSRIDSLIALKQAQFKLLKTRRDLQSDKCIRSVEDQFGLVKLRRLVRGVEQGWSPPAYDQEAKPDEWAVLKTSAVSSGVFKVDEHKKIPDDIAPRVRYSVRDGDLLLVRGSGSSDNVGRAAIASIGNRSVLFSDLIYRLSMNHRSIPEFVAACLNSAVVRSRISPLLRGQSGQTVKLRSEDVCEIEIAAAPMGVQRNLVRDVRGVMACHNAAMAAVDHTVRLLSERKQALITNAITGQLDVTTACSGVRA